MTNIFPARGSGISPIARDALVEAIKQLNIAAATIGDRKVPHDYGGGTWTTASDYVQTSIGRLDRFLASLDGKEV
jgi:hypothetical protein